MVGKSMRRIYNLRRMMLKGRVQEKGMGGVDPHQPQTLQLLHLSYTSQTIRLKSRPTSKLFYNMSSYDERCYLQPTPDPTADF